MNTTFTVIYRVGGTERFEWRKCLPVATRQEALTMKADLERQGYKALYHFTGILNSVGLPDTYDC